MTKNRGGKKFKRKKKVTEQIKIIYKDSYNNGQFYGLITEVLGDCRYKVLCEDGTTLLGSLRGKLRKRVRIEYNDVVIICPREFQNSKGDIVHVYNNIDSRMLNHDPDLKNFLEFNKKNRALDKTINSIDDNVLFTIDDSEEQINNFNLDEL